MCASLLSPKKRTHLSMCTELILPVSYQRTWRSCAENNKISKNTQSISSTSCFPGCENNHQHKVCAHFHWYSCLLSEEKNTVYLGLTYGLCTWNLIQNLIYLNYFGDKKQGEESSDDYCYLVMILHSSTGLVNWLSRTTATRIWVANTDRKTWKSKSCRRIPLAEWNG